jgi:hypothetical protein
MNRRRVPLELTALGKTFSRLMAGGRRRNVTLNYDGEFVRTRSLGLRQSTVLLIIAGLQRATLGGVVIDGKEVTELA